MRSELKGKKILVTAGPTWVPIDRVRRITNDFGGTTGYQIAILAAEKGAETLLLLGPHHIQKADIMVDEPLESIMAKVSKIVSAKEEIMFAGGSLTIAHYRFFDELKDLMERHISLGRFDAVIHSAAVADYAPVPAEGKIKSNLAELAIYTKPTPKIISRIKIWDPKIFQVQFKLEVGLSEEELIERAWQSLVKYRSDLVVANNMAGTAPTTAAAYLIDKTRNVVKIPTREKMYEDLLARIDESI